MILSFFNRITIITAQGSLKIDLSPVPGAPEDGLQISFLSIFETTLRCNTIHTISIWDTQLKLQTYLKGSLATGDFIPATSDIDVLVVTDCTVNSRQFTELKDFHDHLSGSSKPYAFRLEVAFIVRGALEKFHEGLRHPTLEQGEALKWREHPKNWILERWVVRECGAVLYGPNPKKRIEPISPEGVQQVLRSRIGDWEELARNEDDPDWRLPISHKAYVIEMMCRMLYASNIGALYNKTKAVQWALKTLPEPWWVR